MYYDGKRENFATIYSIVYKSHGTLVCNQYIFLYDLQMFLLCSKHVAFYLSYRRMNKWSIHFIFCEFASW